MEIKNNVIELNQTDVKAIKILISLQLVGGTIFGLVLGHFVF